MEKPTARETAIEMLARGESYADVASATGQSLATLRVWKSRYVSKPGEAKQPVKRPAIERNAIISKPVSSTVTETPAVIPLETKQDYTTAGLVAAVALLCIASIATVGDVLEQAFPIWQAGYFIAAVVCLAPVAILISDRVTAGTAWPTFLISFFLEVVCNAIAILEKSQRSDLPETVSALSGGAVASISLAWLLGISLPALALCFEVLLLKHRSPEKK